MSKAIALAFTLALSTCGSTAVPLVDRALREKAKPVLDTRLAAALTEQRTSTETFATRFATLFDAPSLEARVDGLGRAADWLRGGLHESVTVFALGSDGTALAAKGPAAVPIHADVFALLPQSRPTLADGTPFDGLIARPVGGRDQPHRLVVTPVRNHGVVVGAVAMLAPLDAVVGRIEAEVRRASDLLPRAEVCLALEGSLACGEVDEGARAILDATSLGASGTRVERHGTGGSASLVLVTQVEAGARYEALVWAPAY